MTLNLAAPGSVAKPYILDQHAMAHVPSRAVQADPES